MTRLFRHRGMIACLALGAGCLKAPIHDVDAAFSVADAAWFAAEETLFVFYEVEAQQGIDDPSVVEITYATDTQRVPWTPVADLPTVHTHLPVDCGANAQCGSTSLHIREEPREVALRLRYHRDGDVSLSAPTVYNVVSAGPAHTHRSLIVYGVFDGTNQRPQWRARHQFPTLRNQHAQRLGLRRDLTISAQRYGSAVLASLRNPYGYGVNCPSDFVPAGGGVITTEQRAVFAHEALPLAASEAATLCADATVHDATGGFTASAIARKNPEVRPAFPVLRSPVENATPIKFFLAPCEQTISAEHEAMQRQRLLMGDAAAYCIDDWDAGGFVEELVVALRAAVEAERPAGKDMVLVVGIHRVQGEDRVPRLVEEALAQVVPEERDRSTPRLAGAFVFDSTIRGMKRPELSPVVLWCPATLPDPKSEALPDASSRTCAIARDNPDYELGPFSFNMLPIFPSRRGYLDFIDTYSDAQAGHVKTLTFRAPEFTPASDHIALDPVGVATFFNHEVITAELDDAFSYCEVGQPAFFVFRSETSRAFSDACEDGAMDDPFCTETVGGLIPISALPLWHGAVGEGTYELGIVWDFPFLLRLRYETVAAGSVSAFSASVPFGISASAEAYYGTGMWTQEEFSLAETLTQCRRFCDHPTFDSAGIYHAGNRFREAYALDCYSPRYPKLGDSGFPLDP